MLSLTNVTISHGSQYPPVSRMTMILQFTVLSNAVSFSNTTPTFCRTKQI